MAVEETKVCSRCHIEKPITEYGYINDAKSFSRGCTQCSRDATKRWRLKNLDYARKKARQYYHENKERCKEIDALWRQRNSEYAVNRARQYRKDNRKKLNNAKIIYVKNKRKTDFDFRFVLGMRDRIRQALKAQRANKNNTTYELIGCGQIELKKYLESLFTDGMSWDNYGIRGWHMDHIRPCASFDLTDPEQQKICFHFSNLQPLWAKDNQMKGAKVEQ